MTTKKAFYQFPYQPDSGKTDQDFTFLDQDKPDFLVNSYEEAIESLEKLLSKRKTLTSIELEEENITFDVVQKTISKGKAVFSKLTYPAQLTIPGLA